MIPRVRRAAHCRVVTLFVLGLFALGAPTPACAQTGRESAGAGARASVGARDSAGVSTPPEPVLRRRDAFTLGAFAVGATVAFHNDRGVARAFQRPQAQDNNALRNVATVFRNTGQPGVLLGGVATYAVGRMAHRPAVAAAGWRVTEAIVVTGALTLAAKYVAGRSRPFVSAGTDPGDFQLGRGRAQGYTSMPSGHTSAAFAAASALAVEWRAAAPGSAPIAVPLLYTGATMVGLSRVYNDKHWASDVVAGAALGTLAGGAVARWGRGHPGNRLERWLLPLTVVPAREGGVRIGFARTVR